MATKTVTDVSLNKAVGFDDPIYEDDTFTAAGAATFLKGTILARDSVSLKLVLFVKGGATNENGIPKAVLPEELVATGAGDLPIRALVRAVTAKQRLVIDADGDASNIDSAVEDQLRSLGIVVRENRDLSENEA